MNRFAIAFWTVAVLGVSSAAAWAQEPRRASVPLWGEPEALPQVRKKEHAFSVNAGLEWWRAEMEFTDSSDSAGTPGSLLEQQITLFAQHTSAILSLEYAFLGLVGAEIRAHLGVGYESIVTTREDDNPPPDVFENRFDDSFLFEVGAAFVYKFTMADARASLLYRMGDSEADVSSVEEVTYEYTLIRVAGEVGVEAMPGVRPFVGLRYTLYESEWEYEDSSGPFTLTHELEFEQPFGVFVGVELGSGQGAGRLEIDFIDMESVGLAVSVGLGF